MPPKLFPLIVNSVSILKEPGHKPHQLPLLLLLLMMFMHTLLTLSFEFTNTCNHKHPLPLLLNLNPPSGSVEHYLIENSKSRKSQNSYNSTNQTKPNQDTNLGHSKSNCRCVRKLSND